MSRAISRAAGAAILGLSTTVSAATITVPGNQPTIQAAIAAAQNGDTILVSPGTYHEAINLSGKAITLKSAAGADVTVIDAAGLGVVSVARCTTGEGPATVLEGFTLRGGTGTLEGTRKKGGGMFNRQSSPTVRDCVFIDNTITGTAFSVTGSGAGMYNEQASPTVLGCTFASNQLLGCAGWLNGGAGMYNDQSSPILRDCRFLDNQGNNGGGIMNVNLSHPIIDRCVFDSNHATYSGGGLNNTEDSGATVVNCLFRANSAFHGAGMYTTGSVIEVTNCTVVANVATSTGGGIYLMYAPTSCAIANSIFRSNVATANPAGKEIDRYLGAISTVNNCNVEGGWSGPGWSNIDADPLFVDAGAGDLHLEPGSPSVDSGLNLSLPQGIDSDLDGLTRVVNTTVDMGSYEQQGTGPGCPRDLSGDGTVDVDDLIALFAAWGSCPSCTGPCPPDLNGDCLVNVIDLVDLMDGWGTCP